MQCNIKLINGRLAAALESLSSTLLAARRSVWNAVSAFEVALLASMSSGTTSWIAIIEIGRRERFEILKIVQGLGEGVVAVDKGGARFSRALEESIARRNREDRMWSAFLDLFWIGRRVDDPPPSAHQR